MPVKEVHKERKMLKKKLQDKQVEMMSLNQDYNFLRVKRKVLQDILDGKHIENYHWDSKNTVGFNPALKNIEYLQNFDKFPLQFANSDLPTKIRIFREN